MAITRANPGGWGSGGEVTYAQMNEVDINTTRALDKRAGETDSLQSVVTCTGAGRIVLSTATGADANTSYAVGGGNLVIHVAALTANRAYTLSTTGAVAGDQITIFCAPSLTYEVTVSAGATPLFVLGQLASSDGPWATFMFIGGAWVLFHGAHGSRLRSQAFTASGSVVVPPGVSLALAVGYGAGGGGGAGFYHTTIAASRYHTGGGGGGGALQTAQLMAVTPGQTLTVTIGAGGAGGPSNGLSGSDGAATTVGNGSTTWTFPGGAGGIGGYYVDGSGNAIWILGGSPVAPTIAPNNYFSGASSSPPGIMVAPSTGGYGRIRGLTAGGTGGASAQGYAGGAAAAGGADAGGYAGGGGGGGGGAGPGGTGGAGGAGGAAHAVSTGAAGTAGTAAAANTGAGGGGGGGGGMGDAGANLPGAGAAGGSGKLTILWVK